jgi:hypothetical protein
VARLQRAKEGMLSRIGGVSGIVEKMDDPTRTNVSKVSVVWDAAEAFPKCP